MADVLFAVTVDLGRALHALCNEVQARIDAAKDLPQTATRCSRLLDQIDGMVDGLNQEDKRTRVILGNIQSCVAELDLLLTRLLAMADGVLGKSSVCLCITLASKGKDVKAAEKELGDTEDELRKHVESLVQATQLHKFSTRTANKLKQADARRFWDEHFGDQREVSVETLAEALRFEVNEREYKGLDSEVALPICRQCFAGQTVTVLGFGEVFATASISDTMAALSKRVKAQSHMFAVKVFDYEEKKIDQTTEPGFFMCRASDSLKVIRHLVMTHALTLGEDEDDSDDEFTFNGGVVGTTGTNDKHSPRSLHDVPPEFRFMASGEFSFFLDNGAVRVTRKQEKTLEGEEYLSRVVLVRNDDLPDSLRPKKKVQKSGGIAGPGSNDDTAWETESRAGEGSSMGDGEDTEAYAEDVAEAIMRRASEELAVSSCRDIVTALRTPGILQGLRVAVVRARLPEEALTFLVEVDQLRRAAGAISPTAAGALSLPRLRMVKASATNIATRFLAAGASYGLPVSDEVRATAANEIAETASLAEQEDPPPFGLDQRMLEALVVPFLETEKTLAPALGLLRRKQANQNKVVTGKNATAGDEKKKHRVVILGGGDAGNTVAFDLARDDRFHVTLVDPKNYFEDVTAQPMLLCNPGTATEGRWCGTVCAYGTVIDAGSHSRNSHVPGFAMSVSKSFVEVGSERAVVPYDSLVITTGSSYSSNIKIENPTAEFRLRQLQAEAAVIRCSDTILVIGGGLVGVECASNIGERYPGKRVVLVQSGSVLLPRVPKAHAKIMKRMEQLGVEVHLNERVIAFDDMLREYKTDKGNVFHAGKVYRCVGATPNTGLFKDDRTDPAIAAQVDDKGFVKVTAYCQLNGFTNVYAGGDILEDKMFGSSGAHAVDGNQYPERIASTAFIHGLIIARNIKRKLDGEPEGGANLCSFDKNNDPFGAALEISLGLECGLGVVHPVLADIYDSMNFSFGISREELERDKCGVSPEVARNKEQVTALVMGAFQNVEMNQIVQGMFGGDPKMKDPLAPPPGGAPEGGAPEAAPEAAPVPEAVAEEPEAVPEAVAEEPEAEPDAVAEEPEPEPAAVAEVAVPEPEAVAEEPEPEPAAVAEEPEVVPEAVAEEPEAEPDSVAEEPEVVPEAVAEEPEAEPDSVAEEPEAEPAAVAEVAVPEAVPAAVAEEPEAVPEAPAAEPVPDPEAAAAEPEDAQAVE